MRKIKIRKLIKINFYREFLVFCRADNRPCANHHHPWDLAPIVSFFPWRCDRRSTPICLLSGAPSLCSAQSLQSALDVWLRQQAHIFQHQGPIDHYCLFKNYTIWQYQFLPVHEDGKVVHRDQLFIVFQYLACTSHTVACYLLAQFFLTALVTSCILQYGLFTFF